jgi:hypothetical protein
MNIMRFLFIIFLAPLIVVGCKSDQTISFSPSPGRADLSVADQRCPISTTNVYYKIERGPGCAYFIPESDYESIGGSGGTKVVVVDGHFPPPAEMPKPATLATAQNLPSLDYSKRDMSLIDDTGTK